MTRITMSTTGGIAALTLLLAACGAQPSRAASPSAENSSAEKAPAARLSAQALTLGQYQSIRVTTPGFTDRFIRHQNGLAYTEVVTASSGDLLKQDATWKIVAGLADSSCYSFESYNYPGEYLRHASSRVRRDRNDGSGLFKSDATWCAKPGLSGTGTSFESKNYPGRYLRHAASQVWLAQKGGPLFGDSATNFEQDSSWNITSPWATSGGGCAAKTWQPNTNYQLGDVVLYPNNGQYYKVVNVIANGTDMTDPTISTWYWQPTTCPVNPPLPPPPPTNPLTANTGKLLGTYYATFAGTVPRLKDIDPNYNLVYLFSATNAGGEPVGTLKFNPPPDGNGAWTNWKSDLQYARSVQKRLMILSVGGAGNALKFTDRTVSTTFVNSVDKLYTDWGGFDGIDFNTFEGDAAPNTPEMIWAAKELKRRHPGFIISAPPAPWNKVDQQFCKDMLTAGALDFCAPQYYDGPQLSDPSYLLTNIKIWTDLLGADRVIVGFGINNELNNYWKIGSAVDTFRQVKAQYPNIKGAFDWRLDWDVRDGYPFAKQFAPLVKN